MFVEWFNSGVSDSFVALGCSGYRDLYFMFYMKMDIFIFVLSTRGRANGARAHCFVQ